MCSRRLRSPPRIKPKGERPLGARPVLPRRLGRLASWQGPDQDLQGLQQGSHDLRRLQGAMRAVSEVISQVQESFWQVFAGASAGLQPPWTPAECSDSWQGDVLAMLSGRRTRRANIVQAFEASAALPRPLKPAGRSHSCSEVLAQGLHEACKGHACHQAGHAADGCHDFHVLGCPSEISRRRCAF